jgi:hypothetical protein
MWGRCLVVLSVFGLVSSAAATEEISCLDIANKYLADRGCVIVTDDDKRVPVSSAPGVALIQGVGIGSSASIGLAHDISYSNEELKELPVMEIYASKTGEIIYHLVANASYEQGLLAPPVVFTFMVKVDSQCMPQGMVLSFYQAPELATVKPLMFEVTNKGKIEKWKAPTVGITGLEDVVVNSLGYDGKQTPYKARLECKGADSERSLVSHLMFSEEAIERRVRILFGAAEAHKKAMGQTVHTGLEIY